MSGFDHLPYRPAAGIMLLNPQGKVWVGQRLDNRYAAWQMPQGGVDPGEDVEAAALRELEEETGILAHLVEIIARAPQELLYDLPPELLGQLWKGKYRGQRQTWFLMRFLGRDEDVYLDRHEPEFGAWQWVEPVELPELIVPFKKALYEDILKAFADHI
jgi:putative (di)nucleoside polyphosphate hydrolase